MTSSSNAALDEQEWPVVPLGELAEFSNGANFTKEAFGRGIKIIGVSDFQDRLFPRWPEVSEVKRSAVSSRRQLLEAGDLVFVRSNGNRALVGRSMLVTPGPQATHSAFTIRARPDTTRVIPQFLAYQMRHAHRTGQMLTATGTNITNLNQTLLANVAVLLPSLDMQRRIVAILAAYDELIENTLQRIEILEEMAQAIYREWFAHFRFPERGDADRRMSGRKTLPAGWKLLSAQTLLTHYIGGGWGQKAATDSETEPAAVIRGTDMPAVRLLDVKDVPRRFHKESTLEKRLLRQGDLVLEVSGGSDSYPVGRSVLISEQLLKALDERVICASFCKLLRVDRQVLVPELFYLQLRDAYRRRVLREYEVRSTGITNFKFKPFLEQHLFLVPSRDFQDAFLDVAGPIFELTQVLGLEIQNLRQTRDFLLPRLMSGEIDVSELDIDTTWLAA